jgi:hypothetical protein
VKRDEHGNPLVTKPEPTRNQLHAAEVILRELNIGDFRLLAADVRLQDLVANPEKALLQVQEATNAAEETGETREQQALSRERVRNAIELMLPALQRAIEANGTPRTDPRPEAAPSQ